MAIERGETISEMEGERKRLLMAIEEWIKACPDCGGKGVIPSDQPWSDSSEWLGCPACGSLRAVVKP